MNSKWRWLIGCLLVLGVGEGMADSFRVNFQAPKGNGSCLVAVGRTSGEIDAPTVEIYFGKASVLPDVPDIEFHRTHYPHVSVKWSPNGRFCVVEAIYRKFFDLSIMDVRGEKLREVVVEYGAAVEPLLTWKGRYQSNVMRKKWLAGDVLQFIVMTNQSNPDDSDDEKTLYFECEVNPANGGKVKARSIDQTAGMD